MLRKYLLLAIGHLLWTLQVHAAPIEIGGLTTETNSFALTVRSTLGAHFEVYHGTTLTGMPWQLTATGSSKPYHPLA